MSSLATRGVVAAICVIGAIVATGTTAATPVTFGEGTYRVGVDIPAGTYRAPRVKPGLPPVFITCYWARLRNFSGRPNSYIASGRSDAPTLVTIEKTDRGFVSHACKGWTSDLSRITRSKTRFGAGTFIVKVDVAPGKYSARCSGSGYWARLRSFTGEPSAIIADASPSGLAIVRISRADRGFTTHGCGTWSR